MIHSLKPERRVKCGFFWTAATCTAVWAYSEGMIELGGRLLALDLAATLFVELISRSSPVFAILAGSAFIVARSIYCGRRGGDWFYRYLLHQGYRECRAQSSDAR